MMPSACRGCGAPIRWAVTEGGNRIPLDAEPDEAGNCIIIAKSVPGSSALTPVVRVLGGSQEAIFGGPDPDEPRYRAHFVTCPDADSFRKRR